MTKYVASVNTPGYLPESDALVFDTATEAWSYLADDRREAEDMLADGEGEYTETVAELDARAAATAESEHLGPGVVYGGSPGYQGKHDLGLAYVVSAVSDADADEIEAAQG